MLLAENSTGQRIAPCPGAKGRCPFCKSEVIPKCGEIKTWHWAHKSKANCDSWGEPEGEWHYGWKKLAGLDNTEITIEKNGKRHRADVVINGLVIELQHSPLPTYEVREREQFYGRMIWIIDGGYAKHVLYEPWENPGAMVNTEKGMVLNKYFSMYRSDTLLCRSDYPVERWISKNGMFYYKWRGTCRAWVEETSASKWIHFSELHIKTYFWETGKYSKSEYKWMVDLFHAINKDRSDTPPNIKYIKKECSKLGIVVLRDVLVNPKGKFCEILSKYKFAERYLGFKQKSLFDF